MEGTRRLEAILFAKTVVHRHVALMMFDGEIVSAGFFYLAHSPHQTRQVKTTGSPESLQVGRQDFDADHIAQALGLAEHPLSGDLLTHHYAQGKELIERRKEARRQRAEVGIRRSSNLGKWEKTA